MRDRVTAEPDPASGGHTADVVCPTCRLPRAGRFCSACGERFLSHEDLELKHYFLSHLPHELFHVDGKLWFTMRALFTRPGEFAAQYVAGRRQPYLDPLRLYIVIFVVHAFLFSLAPLEHTLPELSARLDPTGWTAGLVAQRTQVNWNDPVLAERLTARGHWLSEIGTMLIVFVVAAFQAVVLRRFGRRYLEHLALALNVFTFFLCIVSLIELLVAIAARGRLMTDVSHAYEVAIGIFAPAVLPIYWFLAIRRFYGATTPSAAGYALAVTLAQIVVAPVLNVLVLALLIETA